MIAPTNKLRSKNAEITYHITWYEVITVLETLINFNLLAINKLYLISVQSSPVSILNKVKLVSDKFPYGSGEFIGEFGDRL